VNQVEVVAIPQIGRDDPPPPDQPAARRRRPGGFGSRAWWWATALSVDLQPAVEAAMPF
jgi:hypothetical protein